MSAATQGPVEATGPPLGTGNKLARLVLIGAILATGVACFAYLGGWLSPAALTPAKFVDGFEEVNGLHPGFRRNHAKGVCVSGYFESNDNGVPLSKALVFQPGRVPVIGRFSLSGGQPFAADTPSAVRGLGLQFTQSDGQLWRTAMVNLSVFPFRTPLAFFENLLASKLDAATGRPDPARVKSFLERHPETEKALAFLKGQPMSSGFANSSFYGLNAFRFADANGVTVPVRWLVAPEQPFEADVAPQAGRDRNYLFDDLIAAIHHQPLRWRLVVIVGQPGDSTNDATIAWPETRARVDVGVLTLDAVQSEDTSPTRDINFDPLVLPSGIAPSDDPLLSARSAVYSQSFTRRAGEPKPASALTPAEVQKGN